MSLVVSFHTKGCPRSVFVVAPIEGSSTVCLDARSVGEGGVETGQVDFYMSEEQAATIVGLLSEELARRRGERGDVA